jgi:hypothetical protein
VSDFPFPHFILLVDLMSDVCRLFWTELLTEVESLRSATDFLVDFVRASAGRREERLLSA